MPKSGLRHMCPYIIVKDIVLCCSFDTRTPEGFQLRCTIVCACASCSNTGSIKDDPCLTSRKNSLELIELSSIKQLV